MKKSRDTCKLHVSVMVPDGRIIRRGAVVECEYSYDETKLFLKGRHVRTVPSSLIGPATAAPRPMLLVLWRKRLGKYVRDLRSRKVGTEQENRAKEGNAG